MTMRRIVPFFLCCLVVVGQARAAAPKGRYEAGVRSIEDRRSRLVWARSPAPSLLTYTGAEAYCLALVSDGGGWRMPTLMELQTLVDVRAHDPAVDPAFDEVPVDASYWSSTGASPAGTYWTLSFVDGSMSSPYASSMLRVRCVKPSRQSP